MPARLARQIVDYIEPLRPGTIIIDTPNTYLDPCSEAEGYSLRHRRRPRGLHLVRHADGRHANPNGPIGQPPPEMISRQPYLPRFIAGGPGNPLGARALISVIPSIASTAPTPCSIGKQGLQAAASACNEDVIDSSSSSTSAPRWSCCRWTAAPTIRSPSGVDFFRVSDVKNGAVSAPFFAGPPSFETPACGGLLRMRWDDPTHRSIASKVANSLIDFSTRQQLASYLRSGAFAASRRGSGRVNRSPRVHALHPSFETPACGGLLRMRSDDPTHRSSASKIANSTY